VFPGRLRISDTQPGATALTVTRGPRGRPLTRARAHHRRFGRRVRRLGSHGHDGPRRGSRPTQTTHPADLITASRPSPPRKRYPDFVTSSRARVRTPSCRANPLRAGGSISTSFPRSARHVETPEQFDGALHRVLTSSRVSEVAHHSVYVRTKGVAKFVGSIIDSLRGRGDDD